MPAIPRERKRIKIRSRQALEQSLKDRIAASLQFLQAACNQSVQGLAAFAFQVERVARPLALEESPLFHQRIENPLADLPVPGWIELRHFQQKPLGCFPGIELLAARGEGNEDQQLQQAPGELLLRLPGEQRRYLLPVIREHLLTQGQELRLNLEQVGKMVGDTVRRYELPPGFIKKRLYTPGFVAQQPSQGKIDDPSRLRKAIAHLFEQFQGGWMKWIDFAKLGEIYRVLRIDFHQLLGETRHGGRVRRLLGANALRDQVLDMGWSQQEADRVPVSDLAVKVVLHLACVLDLLLNRAHNPQGMRLGPFTQELKESEIFVEALGRGLGAQKLG